MPPCHCSGTLRPRSLHGHNPHPLKMRSILFSSRKNQRDIAIRRVRRSMITVYGLSNLKYPPPPTLPPPPSSSSLSPFVPYRTCSGVRPFRVLVEPCKLGVRLRAVRCRRRWQQSLAQGSPSRTEARRRAQQESHRALVFDTATARSNKNRGEILLLAWLRTPQNTRREYCTANFAIWVCLSGGGGGPRFNPCW